LLHDARSLIAGWSSLEELHGAADGAVKGALKVAAPIALGQLHLADIAARFLAAHPKLNLTVQLEDQPIRFAEVGCDLWLKVGPVSDETLVVRPLARVEWLVVAGQALRENRDVRTPAAVERLPFIALARFESGRIGLRQRSQSAGNAAEITPELRLTTDDVLVVRRAALLGVGAAVLPRWLVVDDLTAGRLVDVLPDWRATTLAINAAYLPACRQPLRLTHFVAALAAGIDPIAGLQSVRPPSDAAGQGAHTADQTAR
jgi:DNA-binding transcriptional LysR family regulator